MIPDEKLLRALGPECKLVFWLAPGELAENTPGFTTINYLLDGLVRSHLSDHSKDLRQVVFHHQSFGQNFQVVFLDSAAADSATFVQQARSILNTEKVLGYVALGVPASWRDLLRDDFNCHTLVECPANAH